MIENHDIKTVVQMEKGGWEVGRDNFPAGFSIINVFSNTKGLFLLLPAKH